MNNWPRKLLAILLLVLSTLGVATTPLVAQTVISDTEMVGIVVDAWECPQLQTPEDAEPTPFGPGSCPTPTPGPDNGNVPSPTASSTATSTIPTEVTETPVAVSTNSVGGFGSTVPVVAQLPDTGTSPEGDSSHWMLATMLTAGILLTVGGLLNSRTDQ